MPALVDLYKQGRLKLDELVSGRFPLEKINEAIAGVTKGAALRNVICSGRLASERPMFYRRF